MSLAADAGLAGLFKENLAKMRLPREPITPAPRLTCCMKRTLLLSAVLFGVVAASQAGVQLNIGINIPLPGVVIAAPAPAIVAPPVVWAAPPAVIVAPPFVVAPPPVYYVYRPGWYGYSGWGYHRGWHHGR